MNKISNDVLMHLLKFIRSTKKNDGSVTVPDEEMVCFFDNYGVIKKDTGFDESALTTLKRLVDAGVKVFIISNTTALNESTIKSYAKGGLIQGIHYHDVMTSGQFAAEDIAKGALPFAGKKFWVFGTANFKNPDPTPAIFQVNTDYTAVANIDEADFIYCGIPQIDGQDLTDINAFVPLVEDVVRHGKPLLCVNPDRFANEKGKYVVRQGTIAKLYQEMGGEVVYYGKPDPRIMEAIIERLCPNVPRGNMIMFGDTGYTDIRVAHLAGMYAVMTMDRGFAEYEMEQLGLTLEEYLDTLPDTDVPDEIIQSL